MSMIKPSAMRHVGGNRAVGLALAAVLVPALLAAQQPQQSDSSHCICWNQRAMDLAGHMARISAFGGHAMIGVTMAPDSGQGVRIEDVTAGGPAARAGLKAGDVLTGIDDVDLGSMSGSDAQDALVQHLQSVDPGDTVSVTFRRNGGTQHAKIVTESASRLGVFGEAGPGVRVLVNPGSRSFFTPGAGMITARGGDLPNIVRRTIVERTGGSIPGLDVVDVNPALGKYFDVDHGVLVVNVDTDSDLGLKPGDVILKIGDRSVDDAWHAVRILRSYRSDETIRMDVMRNRKNITVTGHMP